MTDKRFIYDGLYIRDLHGKIPPILTDNDKLIDKYLKELNGLHDEVKKLSHKNMQLDILIRDDRLVQHALKTKNEQLQKDREELFIRERDTKNEWRELKQENERLRKCINTIYTIARLEEV